MGAYAVVLAIMATTVVVLQSTHTIKPTQQRTVQTVQGQWLLVYGQAAQVFITNNPGYAGAISDAQLQPELGPWQSLPAALTQAGLQHGALVQGGRLYAWISDPTSGSSAAAFARLLQREGTLAGDGALMVNESGQLVNPIVGSPTAAPAGIPNGAFVYAPT